MRPELRRALVRARAAGRRAAWPLGSVVSVAAPERIVLTFDDGPEPGGTDAVLSALADAGVHATFFVLMTRVRRYPALLGELVAAGHEIGLHGVDHRALPTLPAAAVRTRSRDGRAELEDAVGQPVRWLRPPYGRLDLPSWAAVRSAGMLPVLWGPSTEDAVPATHEQRVRRAEAAEPGAILLAHDGFAGPADGVDDGPPPVLDRGALAAALIARYRDRGLRPGSLGEAIGEGRARRSAVFVG